MARLQKQKRPFLTISEVLEINPYELFPFQWRHLAIILLADKDMDGVFSFEDFEHFCMWVQINIQPVQHEFRAQLQARACQKMILYLQKNKNGLQNISNWFMKMLSADKPTQTIRKSPYVKIQAIKVIYEIFNIQIMHDLDIQSFFYLVKRSAQDLGFPVEEVREGDQEDQFQEYIQMGVCREFIGEFLKGVLKILKQIGYGNTLSL